jgi:hypothetical protein
VLSELTATTSWPTVSLSEVLRKSDTWITPEPMARYSEVTVRLWGRGVVERRTATGAAIAGRRLVVQAGQFIVSRIDARNGAFGIVPDSLDGAVVSNDFPAFDPDTSQLVPAFLGWMSRTLAARVGPAKLHGDELGALEKGDRARRAGWAVAEDGRSLLPGPV